MPRYNLINEKLLMVTLSNGEEVYAKKGSMLAYQGQVQFQGMSLSGNHLREAVVRHSTGEDLDLMRAKGSGQIYYGHEGMIVTVVQVEHDRLYIESDNVLAFDQRLRSGIEFLGNHSGGGGLSNMVRGAMSQQGLYTTTLDGYGEVAVISSGDLISLNVDPSKPVFVDPDAYVGHKGNLTTSIHMDANWKLMLGKNSGEVFQLKFTGQGTVFVQADER